MIMQYIWFCDRHIDFRVSLNAGRRRWHFIDLADPENINKEAETSQLGATIAGS
jgi:hypothetical protein